MPCAASCDTTKSPGSFRWGDEHMKVWSVLRNPIQVAWRAAIFVLALVFLASTPFEMFAVLALYALISKPSFEQEIMLIGAQNFIVLRMLETNDEILLKRLTNMRRVIGEDARLGEFDDEFAPLAVADGAGLLIGGIVRWLCLLGMSFYTLVSYLGT